jgi:hypothetical protein
MEDQKILDAFETMWGPFPEPVMLIRKDRTILATNALARTAGVPTDIKCYSLNPEAATSACKNCKANLALREHRAITTEEVKDGHRVIGYWMPLKDAPDMYVHFGVGLAASMGLNANSAAVASQPDLVALTH